MVDWLIDWLFDRIIIRLAKCLNGWLTDGWTVWLTDFCIFRTLYNNAHAHISSLDYLWMVDWLIDWLFDWLTDLLTVWMVDLLMDRPFDWLTDRLTVWMVYWVMDRLLDGLTDWVTDHPSSERRRSWSSIQQSSTITSCSYIKRAIFSLHHEQQPTLYSSKRKQETTFYRDIEHSSHRT